MSSTILHNSGLTRSEERRDIEGDGAHGEGASVLAGMRADAVVNHGIDGKNAFLVALGERVRDLRARRGLTRKAAAQAAHVSERHLANLEYGSGNASILVLQQVAGALQCSLAELIGDVTTSSPEWLLLREMLEHRDEATLRRVRIALGEMLGTGGENAAHGVHSSRVALIGLRGAGKSTLGQMLADDLGFPFVELSREIEKFAGCSISEIQGLYGMNAYRRYERRALEEAIQIYPEAVIATPGGLVSDAATFNQLLAHCTTVWLQARPEDHMNRVRAQGDFRPMAASKEAMEDLRHILAGRAAFYSKAEFQLDTSAQPLEPTFSALRTLVREALKLPL
ncbi:helix-turn-helix transcriptional regulator [Burkholderia sp. BE17]|uniref:helix-turn-helix transcriptional regulator n=1 Tax=Burkholderia sp. BE17 TaxID=2656644 RepID=UPI00128E8834|nr:helix-turn-helix transcriptional regulator [Burkholderia sp. BE17]MPV66831.1 helix-turn-helix domain-containing protein [Burkholderia sp. BE17]